MNRRPMFVPALAALALSLPAPSVAQDPASVRQAIQAVCSRSAAGYGRRDLTAFMSLYDPAYQGRNVSGRASDFRLVQAGVAQEIARKGFDGVARCAVTAVTVTGGQAQVTLVWHFVNRYGSGRSARVVATRDYTERSVWMKRPGGWRDVRAQMTRDALVYQR